MLPDPAIRVLVADDHPIFLDGVIALLNATADIKVVGQACAPMNGPRSACT